MFASLAADGPSFEDHIGPIKSNIDDLVDRAPDGTLAFDLGMHRYVFDGNWKLQVENVLDSYHVPFGHASTVNKDGVQFARREGDKSGAKVVEADQQKTAQSWKGRRSYIVGNGHGWTSNTASTTASARARPSTPTGGRWSTRSAPTRAEHILTPRLHNTLIYPNVSIMGLNIHVRVIKPIAVDRTEINVYPVRLVGAPDAMNFGNLRLLNVTHSAASFVQTDDIEAFVRTQKGLRCDGARMGRHLARPRRRGARPRAQRDARLGDPRDGGAGPVQGVGRLHARGRVMDDAPRRRTRSRRPCARRPRRRSRLSSCTRRGCSMRGASATGWRCSPRTAPTGCRPCRTRRARSTRRRCSTTTAT